MRSIDPENRNTLKSEKITLTFTPEQWIAIQTLVMRNLRDEHRQAADIIIARELEPVQKMIADALVGKRSRSARG